MLISPRPRSTSSRRSSVEHANFFFEPVQLDFQPPNLFVEGVVPGLNDRALPGPAIYKNLRQLLHSRLPPLRDLDGMHLELRAQLAQCLLTPNRFDRHSVPGLRVIPGSSGRVSVRPGSGPTET